MPAYSSTTSTVHRENQKKLTRIVSFETNTAAKRSESDKICHVAALLEPPQPWCQRRHDESAAK